MQDHNSPSRRQQAAERQADRASRRGIRFFPDILVILLAIAVLVITLRPGHVSTSAKGDETVDLGTSSVSGDGLMLSEVMALNKGAYASADGNYYDWIELYNPTSDAINLEGYALSDNMEKLSKYVLPSHVIEAGGYAIIFASGLSGDAIPAGELHAGFKLSSMGETVYLSDAQGHIMDQTTYDALGIDQTYARTAKDEWEKLDYFTPLCPNTKEGYSKFLSTRVAPESPVKVNEIMSSNSITTADEDGDYVDWMELHNTSDQPVSLYNYGLSDDSARTKRWVFPDVTLQPGEYLVIYLSGKNKVDPAGKLHANFRMSSYQGTLYFSDPKGAIIEEVHIDELETDASYGRIEGTDQWQVYSHPTPGFANTEAGFNALQPAMYADMTSPVIISEVMNNNKSFLKESSSAEAYSWVELYNRSDASVSLAGWSLSDNTGNYGKWHFPDDASIAPGQYMTVFTSGLDKTDSAEGSKKKYHTNFSISAMGEALILANADGALADRCMVPWTEQDMSYGRAPDTVIFKYITSPTPGEKNNDGYLGFAPQPVFSQVAGLYDGAQNVELQSGGVDGCTIYYTLDCSDPTNASSQYTGSAISFDKTTVVRARAYAEGYLPSRVATATYLVDEVHTLPVISLVTDPKNLFDETTGILVKGPNAEEKYPYKGANFWQKWEVESQLQMFDEGGALVLNQPSGLRLFGAYSRTNDMKNYALFARGRYGSTSFDYPLFSELPYTSYKSFVLRNGASEWNVSKIRDVVLASLVRDTTDLDTQASQPCVVFQNGEFWGVYFIQEKLNEAYFEQHHNVRAESLNLLVGNGNSRSTTQAGSNQDYQELISWVKEHDLSVQENYDYVAGKVDIQNYMDYVICEMYVYNTDTGNIKYWMSNDKDGKWRWIFYDVDWAFWPTRENRDGISRYLNEKGHGVNSMFDNSLIRGLLNNAAFRQQFIERFAYHVNVTFEPERVVQRITTYASAIDGEMAREKEKWKYGNYDAWVAAVDRVKNYARKRPEYVKAQLKSYFNISDEEMARLFPQ
ncbi:MAG: lamin tail domain-containing protein [Eubacteriales bacterium]|nr:lamin tail domain-containing protein [Eubacteriales bacterium]